MMTADMVPTGSRRIAMLLLGSPILDARVLKTIRSLQASGYQVTLWCVSPPIAPGDLPELAGATINVIGVARPLAWIGRTLRRIGRADRHHSRSSQTISPDETLPGLLADARAILGTLWINLALWRAARREPAAYIHAHDLDTLLAGRLLRRSLQARLIYDAHELYPEMIKARSALYQGTWRLIEHYMIDAAAAVVTVNGALADELQRRHKLPHRPTVVMNCPLLEPAPDKSRQPRHEVAVIYQGGLHAERGLEDLVRAFAHLPAHVILYLRGPGPLRHRIEAVARASGLDERVRILPTVVPDKLVSSLGQFTIGIVPYVPATLNTFLSTPNKLFEYMMAGLPVVVGDLPEIRRIVLAHGVGQVYSALNVSAMVVAIRDLIGDEVRLAACAKAAREAAIHHYHWEIQASNLLDAYLASARSPQ